MDLKSNFTYRLYGWKPIKIFFMVYVEYENVSLFEFEKGVKAGKFNFSLK